MLKSFANPSRRIRSFTTSALLLIALLLALAATSRADETYTYSGNKFTSFSGTAACPSVCGISGSFTLASALPDDAAFPTSPTPLTYSFTDGSFTWTPSNSSLAVFEFGTNSSGGIDAWIISIFQTTNVEDTLYTCGSSVCGSSFHYTGYDNSQLVQRSPLDILANALVVNNAGTWVASASAGTVPEPSGLLLLGMGIIGLSSIRRRVLL